MCRLESCIVTDAFYRFEVLGCGIVDGLRLYQRRSCSIEIAAGDSRKIVPLVDGESVTEVERRPEAEIHKRVEESLTIVDLLQAQDKKPAELSGGMRKRAGLARAVVANPKYILYDEPTTGLDPIRADNINQLILRLHDQLHCTGVAVTHDMVSAYKIADRIAMLHEGTIHVVGTPEEIQATQDPIVKQFITGVGDVNQEVQYGAATVH